MSDTIRHVTISGRVQGVGYRAFVDYEARSRDLEGRAPLAVGARCATQVAAVGGVADQRLVAPLQLLLESRVRGIIVEEVESTLEGDLDLRGFLDLSPTVRKGYQNIRLKLRIKANPSDEAAKSAT